MASTEAEEIAALTQALTRAAREYRWSELARLIDATIQREWDRPGTIGRSEWLRNALFRVARMTKNGVRTTNYPFTLVSGVVGSCALVTAWWRETVLKAVGVGGGILLTTLAVGFVGAGFFLWYQHEAFSNSSEKLRFLANELRSTGRDADKVVARVLDEIAAGAPPRRAIK